MKTSIVVTENMTNDNNNAYLLRYWSTFHTKIKESSTIKESGPTCTKHLKLRCSLSLTFQWDL